MRWNVIHRFSWHSNASSYVTFVCWLSLAIVLGTLIVSVIQLCQHWYWQHEFKFCMSCVLEPFRYSFSVEVQPPEQSNRMTLRFGLHCLTANYLLLLQMMQWSWRIYLSCRGERDQQSVTLSANECLTFKLVANYYARGCGFFIRQQGVIIARLLGSIAADYWKMVLQGSYVDSVMLYSDKTNLASNT